MAKIDELTKKIDELISAIKNIGNAPNGYQLDKDDIRKKFEIETKGMKKRSKEYKKMYEKMEFELELHEKNMQRIQDESNKKREEKEKRVLEKEEKEKKKHSENIHKQLVQSNKDEMELLNIKLQEELEKVENNENAKKELIELYANKQNEILEKNFKQGLSNFTKGFQSLYNLGKKVEQDIQNSYGAADQEAVNYGRAIGLNAREVSKLRGEMINFMADGNMAMKYNMSTNDAIKLVGTYTKEIGRAISLTNDQTENLLAMNRLMGEDKSAKFAASFEKFGLNIDAASEFSSELFDEAGRRGLSFEKISNNFLNNIELAQQYTFEDGVEGLKRMAVSAAEVNWNMQQTASFAEKVNNVEGAIKTGAQLSVLGGPFAQFSNPMGMLYESLNDMEGLQERLFAMFGSLGEWDNSKGQLDISAFNRQRIRAAASAMGLNYGDVINTINQQARRQHILNNIRGLGFDDETQNLIANTAQLDENGEAFVTINGVRKNVKDGLTNEEKELLVERTKSSDEDIKDIAQSVKSILEHQQSVEKERLNQLSRVLEDTGIGENMHNIYDLLGNLQNTILIIQGAILAIQAMQYAGQIATGLHQMVGNRGGFGSVFNRFLGGNRNFQSPMNIGGAFGRTNARNLISTYGSASAARSVSISAPIGAGIGIASGIGGIMLGQEKNEAMQNGDYSSAHAYGIGESALEGLGLGASIGGFFGPLGLLIGGGIGLLAGGAYGYFSTDNEIEEQRRLVGIRNQYTHIFNNTGVNLQGDYNDRELNIIRSGRNAIARNDGLYAKMMQYDRENYYRLPEGMFANGGIVNGDTHANGGTLIEAEKNEFVVNAKSTENNLSLLKSINDNPFKSLQPMGQQLWVTPGKQDNNHHMMFDNLKIDMNGGLQVSLVGGQTQNINTNELLSNPGFIRGIRDEIIRQINYTTDKTFNRDNYYRKW